MGVVPSSPQKVPKRLTQKLFWPHGWFDRSWAKTYTLAKRAEANITGRLET